MVKVLTAVLTDGLVAVEAAGAESLAAGVASADVILNALARRQQPQSTAPIATPERCAAWGFRMLLLTHPSSLRRYRPPHRLRLG